MLIQALHHIHSSRRKKRLTYEDDLIIAREFTEKIMDNGAIILIVLMIESNLRDFSVFHSWNYFDLETKKIRITRRSDDLRQYKQIKAHWFAIEKLDRNAGNITTTLPPRKQISFLMRMMRMRMKAFLWVRHRRRHEVLPVYLRRKRPFSSNQAWLVAVSAATKTNTNMNK